MRVISQDGTIDIPYGLTSIQLVSKTTIVAQGSYFGSGNDNFATIAEYSTEAKAQKAMEMLREKYLQYISLQGGESAFVEAVFQPNYWVLPKVFQFPQDDEIEV